MPDKAHPAQGSEKTFAGGLDTKSGFCDLDVPQMKTTTKQRVQAIAIGLLIAAVIVIQGLLETNPNH